MYKMTEASTFQMFVYFEKCHYISCPRLPIHQMWSFSHITVCDITTGEGDTSLLRNVRSIHLFPTLCFHKTVSDCPLQWEMSFHLGSNMKPFLLFWCSPLLQTSSKTTRWWCVAISYCVDDTTLSLLHPFHIMWMIQHCDCSTHFILCGWYNTVTAPPISSSLIWLPQ